MFKNEELWVAASCEIVRAVRGRRSQVAFSRRLGYKSNVAADWEGGHRFPTALVLINAMNRVGLDVSSAFRSFHCASFTAWEEGLPSWLQALQGHTSQGQIAGNMGCSRHQVRRWLSGESNPRLPQFLALVNVLTGRTPDWVASFVCIDDVPSLRDQYYTARTAARLAYEHPWSAAIRVLIESDGYRSNPSDDFLSQSLGISGLELEEAVNALVRSGLADRSGERLKTRSTFTSDIQASPEDIRRLKAHWARVAADRLESPRSEDLVSLNLATLSKADLERVKQLQRAYFRELRSIVAASKPEESAVLVLMQVLSLAPG